MELRRLLWAVAVIVACGALLSVPAAASSSGADCGKKLGIVPGAAVQSPAMLAGIDGLSSTDIWAVGQQAGGHSLAEHWDGSKWQKPPMPPVGSADTLFGVSAVSPNDVWAVGAVDDTDHHSLIEHWNGTSWSRVPVDTLGDLNGVDGLSSSDAWAVGAGLLALRWDGTQWVRIPPPAIIEEGEFHAVQAFAGDNVWAVGERETERGGGETEISMLLQWNGTTWVLITNPPELIDATSGLKGVSGTSPTDIWAVGDIEGESSSTTLAVHYDGSNWTVVDTPNPSSEENELSAVSAVAPDDVWASGTFAENGVEHPMVMHWNGRGWKLVKTEAAPGATAPDSLLGIFARPNNDVWAVGLAGPSDPESQPLIEHTRC